MKYKILLLLLSLLYSSLQAQKIDSLKAVLDTAKNERKVKTLNELFRANLQSDPVIALAYTREALSLATEVNDQKGLAASYNNLGIAYRNQGALDKALEYYINSLKIYESLDNKEGIASTKNNISTIYSMKKDYDQALKYLEESYNIFLTLDDPDRMIGSLNNLGTLYTETQRYDKAMRYFTEANELIEKHGKSFSDVISNIGTVYARQGNFQRAIEHYEKALQLEQESNNRLAILNLLTNLGITYAKAKEPRLAQRHLDEAKALCNQLQAFSLLPSIYRAFAENYAAQSMWKEAYDTQLKYDEVREKIYGEESSRNIAQMEIILNFQETEKEFELLKHEDEIKTLQLHNTQLFVVLIIMGILVTLGVLNYVFLSKKKIVKSKPGLTT